MLVLATSLALTLAPLVQTQTCPVLIDINTTPIGLSSTWDPGEYDFAAAPGGDLFFAGHQAATGTELWRTDGTAAGTVLVADLLPGPLGTAPRNFYAAGGVVYFSAGDIDHGRELWRSDGTAAGTFMVADIEAGPGDSHPSQFLSFGGAVYFQAFTTGSGYELWRSNGTAAGTVKVKEIYTGTNSSAPANLTLTPSGSGFVFRAFTGSGGEPWFSDGRPGGTFQLKDIFQASGSSLGFSTRFVPFGGQLYFAAEDSGAGLSLWRTDGTTTGTQLVVDPSPSKAYGPSTNDFALFGGAFYFSGSDSSTGTELWKSDGTVGGTQLVVDSLPGVSSGSPTELTVFAGELYFVVRTGVTYEYALMATGGTAATTRTVKVMPIESSGHGAPEDLAVVNGRLLFSAGDDVNGREWWASDGTTAGTGLIADLYPGSLNGTDSSLHLVGPNLGVFMGFTASAGRELFGTDGFSVGLIHDLQPGVATLNAQPNQLTPVGGDLYLSANDGVTGSEPYRLTAGGALIALGDVHAGPLGSNPEGFTAVTVGGQVLVFFTAQVNATGRELYVTDGTPNSVTFLGDLSPGFQSSNIPEIVGVGGYALFKGELAGSGSELWRSDGTLNGTQMLVDLNPGSAGSGPGSFRDMGGRVLFKAFVAGVGTELFVTDGTVLGTQLAADVGIGGSSNPLGLTRVGERAVFFGRPTPTTNYGLYVTDGTQAGTTLVSVLGGALFQGPYDELPVVDGVVYFIARASTSTGTELWRSDLTGAGTYMVADLSPGTADTQFAAFQPFAATQSKLFFVAETTVGGFGEELYVTDGTAAGTHLVQDLTPGAGDSLIQGLTGIGSRVFFSAYPGPAAGRELYMSDGNSMTLMCDPSPGSTLNAEAVASSSSPYALVPFRGDLVFGAVAASSVGTELFRLPQPGAYQRDLGLGASALLLDVEAPQLGSNVQLDLYGAQPGALNTILSSPPIASPLFGGALAPLNIAWVNPGALTFLFTVATPSASLSFAVPANPALAGVRLHLQAVTVDPATLPGIVTSNGVEVVVGL